MFDNNEDQFCATRRGIRPFGFLLSPEHDLKHLGMQLIAGGTAGITEIFLLYPLDIIKSRLQFQNKFNTPKRHYYHGMYDCVKRMIMRESFGSLYKGLGPPMVAEFPKRAIKFLTFDTFLTSVYTRPFHRRDAIVFGLAGAAAGMTQAFFSTPFDLVKLNMQILEAVDHGDDAWYVAEKIVHRRGFFGLYRGVSAHLWRSGIFNTVYLLGYNELGTKFPDKPYESTWEIYRKKMYVGGIAGVLAGFCNIPFDVIRIRIQAPCEDPPKYNGIIQTTRLIIREEGVRALYRGLAAKTIRMGIGGGVLMVVYDNLIDQMESIFLKPPNDEW